MENHILVIGNGFDLHHDLKTRYNDFMDYIKNIESEDPATPNIEQLKKIVKNNGFIQYFSRYTDEIPGWIDFENEMEAVLKQFDLFFSNYHTMVTYNGFTRRIKFDRLMKEVLIDFKIVRQDGQNGIEVQYDMVNKYYSNTHGLNKNEILKMLKSSLEELTQALCIYLENVMASEYANAIVHKTKQIEDIKPNYVVNFNYTDTCKMYNIPEENIFYIHGKLDRNNMVLGIKDENKNKLDFVYFKKYFQRIQKLTGSLDINKIYQYDSGCQICAVVYFYGHSMDKTDGDIILTLDSTASQFIIFIYDQEDYERKVINLIDIFGKERAIENIQSKRFIFIKMEP